MMRSFNESSRGRSSPSVWILSILLGLAVAMGGASLVLKQTLLNASFHRKIIEDQLVVRQMSVDLPALFFNIERSPGLGGGTTVIPESLLGELIARLIPESWIEGQVEGLVQRAIDFVESDQEAFAVMVDLTPIKMDLQAKSTDLANSVIAKMPDCTGKDLLGYLNYAITGDNSALAYCLPPKPFDKLTKMAISNSFNFMSERLPDNIEIVKISLENDALRPWVRGLRIVRVMLQVYRVAPYVIFGLLLLLLMTNLKNLRPALHGIGFALLGAGVILLLFTVAILLYGRSLDIQNTGAAAVVPLDSKLLAGYVRAVFQGVESMLLKLAAVLAASGLIVAFSTRVHIWREPSA